MNWNPLCQPQASAISTRTKVKAIETHAAVAVPVELLEAAVTMARGS